MPKKFVVELYCESDASSVSNMIADALHEGFIKSVVAVDDEPAQPRVQATGFWVCPNCRLTNASFRSECSECETARP